MNATTIEGQEVPVDDFVDRVLSKHRNYIASNAQRFPEPYAIVSEATEVVGVGTKETLIACVRDLNVPCISAALDFLLMQKIERVDFPGGVTVGMVVVDRTGERVAAFYINLVPTAGQA